MTDDTTFRQLRMENLSSSTRKILATFNCVVPLEKLADAAEEMLNVQCKPLLVNTDDNQPRDGLQQQPIFSLHAAYRTLIQTYGRRLLTFDLGIRSQFRWIFIVTGVYTAILGADLSSDFGLPTEIQHHTPLDVLISLGAKGEFINMNSKYLQPVNQSYHTYSEEQGVAHITVNKGQIVTARARPLSPEKPRIAEEEFDHMPHLGSICQCRSTGPHALNFVPKWAPAEVEDLLELAPSDFLYSVLNDAIPKRTGKSEAKLLRDLLNSVKLRDRSPYQLLRYMRSLLGLQKSDGDILKQLWAEKLSSAVKHILAAMDDDSPLDKLAALADEVSETFLSQPVCAATATFPTSLASALTTDDGLKHLIKHICHRMDNFLSSKESILTFLVPITMTKQRRFLDILDYYRRFIQNRASVLKPLTVLIDSKHKSTELPLEATEAFSAAKEALYYAIKLCSISYDLNACLLTMYASNAAVGAVLEQSLNGEQKPLAFFFQKLQPARVGYSTFGSRHIVVQTDHNPLTLSFHANPCRYSPREIRHLGYISQFTTDIRHLRGDTNIAADALSRPDVNLV
ncbi:uncharacterized protein DEA37_0000741 [Paragonimus westermani]|uniref:Reverse transcriptase/retrotransposon-derived protein RNase H-like domain-containing protein n=1 Tax=Paragonimus westermani TaxID=34504 RepID=A0A5J4N787_9TREM|nr:uncharacterized protein DEA37_0000741 [Paragonimus westermani]